MAKELKTIGVLTSGGDAPGMNAAIRAVVRRGLSKGLKMKGILKGYDGLLNEEIIDMTAKDVSDIIGRGGTILYTARCAEMRTEEGQKKAADICRKHGIDGLVVIGGDGSFAGAQKLANLGINAVGIPGTIDLDIACTEYTIGFDTAVNTAMEAIDKVRDTSTSHERCSVIEVMGRNAGYLALWCGIANGAEDILLPEKYDYDEQKLINNIIEGRKRGKKHHIIINAEGIGHSSSMAKRIEAATGIETRATILGHMQRGGNPTCIDRVHASMMGSYAVDLLAEGKTKRVVGYKNGEYVDFEFYQYKNFPNRNVRVSNISSYDRKAKSVGIENGATISYEMKRGLHTPPKTEWLNGNTLRVFSVPNKTPLEAGQYYRMQHNYYEMGGIAMNSNKHLRMEDINIYSCCGQATHVRGTQQYWLFKNVNIAPPKGKSRRPISATADHCMIETSAGYLS